MTMLTANTSTSSFTGLVLPGPPGNDVDMLGRRAALECAERGIAILAAARPEAGPGDAPLLDALLRLYTSLPRAALVTLFRHPPAFLDAPPPVYIEDGIVEERTALERARGMARYLIGCTQLEGAIIVLPPASLSPDGMYLPAYNAVLHGGGGPVAVQVDRGTTRFTWADGQAVTLPPPDGSDLPIDSPRLRRGLRAAGLPVLNSSPEVRVAAGRFGFAGPGELQIAIDCVEGGLALLRAVWPEAHAAAERILGGWVILAGRDHTRSHTSQWLHGAILITPYDPVAVGDLICHEASHLRMNLVLARERIFEGDQLAVHPSPWRRDPRPLIGIFNGVHAFLNVCVYYRRLEQVPALRDHAARLFAIQRANVRKGLSYLLEHASPTPVGARLLDELGAAVAEL